ncbi:oxidation resistance protein 1, variant 2 [Entomophthora muscae]|uniref:Oxidation resistance protein 1, variant 2 n=2 Tax=Entomophthora muscae TaxID=34485 RepID=A0ACC2SEZ5_9FUNG|nr:oxidation resistance protein 1, variant 2 [Entomophthora muscae]
MNVTRPFMHHSFSSASKDHISRHSPLNHFPIHIDWRSFFHSPPTTGLNIDEAWCNTFSLSSHLYPPFSKLNKKATSGLNQNKHILSKKHSRNLSLDITTYHPSNALSPSFSGQYTFPELHQNRTCKIIEMDLYKGRVFLESQKNTTSSTPTAGDPSQFRSASLPVYSNSQKPHFNRPSLDMPTIRLEGRDCDSTALTVSIADKLSYHLPSRYRLAKSWNLLYNIDQHGLSMSTMFRRCKDQGPCIIAIRDSENQVFGAYISDPLEPSPSYYGSGESFLWRADNNSDDNTQITKYEWSGLNRYIILCEPEYISIGGGDGKYGLWLDNEFDRGISQTCNTFYNQPLAGPQEEFQCIEFEVWGIGS